jgi:multimeric flavodoxin WrbA
MKIIGVNGSPNPQGNTYMVIQTLFDELHKEGVETELVQVGDGSIAGCRACRACAETGECAFRDEQFTEISNKLQSADGLFLAAPVYFGTMPGQTKAFLDRFFFQCSRAGKMRHKVGASAAILRRTGGYTTIDDLNRFLFSAEMITVGHCIIHGNLPGEIQQDAEGLSILKRTAKNMAWILKMKEATKDDISPPAFEKRPFINFIR